MSAAKVTNTRLGRAKPSDQACGLVGWASCTYGDLRLDAIAIRRTRGGRIAVSFPRPHDGRGGRYEFVRPRNATARAEIERQILEQLGFSP